MLESRVPGCINFIDARTKWFDQAVIDATNARGIKQASLSEGPAVLAMYVMICPIIILTQGFCPPG